MLADVEERVVTGGHCKVKGEAVQDPRLRPLHGLVDGIWEDQVHTACHAEPDQVWRQEEIAKCHDVTHGGAEAQLRRLTGGAWSLGAVDPRWQHSKEAVLVNAAQS